MSGILAVVLAGTGQAALTPLIAKCQPTERITCKENIFRPVWRRVEATNGEMMKIDMASIEQGPNGSALAVTYTGLPGTPFRMDRLQQVWFSCRGQYALTTNVSQSFDAPPRSFIGVAASIVCGKASRLPNFPRVPTGPSAYVPKPSDYCRGFDTQACARIQAGVEAKIAPTYCKPGYGIAGNGLSKEQLRTCGARKP